MAARQQIVRLGIIGCGIAANELHWPALSQLRDRFDVAMVCNRTREKAVSFATRIGDAYGKNVPYVLDYLELLATPNIDAVSIMLPVERNLEVCAAAAAAGKHMMLEKPIAKDMAEAREVLGLEAKHPGLVMMVAENFRYRQVFAELADSLRKDAIGTPYFVEWKSWQLIDPASNPYAQTPWRINHRYEGGFVTDAGVHYVAALRDMLGDLSTVGACSACVNPAIGRMDSLAWLFRTTGKDAIPPLSGILTIGFSVHGSASSSLTILGSRGSAVVENATLRIYADDADNPVSVADYPDGGGYVEEYVDFHQAITTGQKPTSTLDEASKDLDAILHAIEMGQHSNPTLR
ncbi:MAG: Gfo/Idh/MocA family oxidoreductase [Candidatus Atribacteria bacterium]|nr:MAG: Gfo/Idh/MocA family oxidoreductase [Candidatus Atribacteria bacterium]